MPRSSEGGMQCKPRRKTGLSRAALLSALKKKVDSKGGKKIKVIFMCPAGLESSLAAKHAFEKLLSLKGLQDFFELDHGGYIFPKNAGGHFVDGVYADEDVARQIKGSDFVVPLFTDVQNRLHNAVNILKDGKPVIIQSFFADEISEQYKMSNYEKIFMAILGSLR
ncbi:MAG TPA: hypothetical protein VFF09_03770 [archaeon]|nr:hypothetical protein [archaeon]